MNAVMKLCLTHRLRTRINIAACAVVGTLTLAAGVASAQEYVPHPQLTPYQIADSADGGKGNCLQAVPIDPAETNGWSVAVAACDASKNEQRFYVVTGIQDFIPQHENFAGANVQVILAAEYDKVPGRYAVLYNGTNYVTGDWPDPGYTGGPALISPPGSLLAGGDRFLHNVRRTTAWTNYAAEGESFTASQGGTVKRLRYGSDNAAKYKDAAPGTVVQCTNESFGGDPAPGLNKFCLEWDSGGKVTAMELRFENNVYDIYYPGGWFRSCLVKTDTGLARFAEQGCQSIYPAWTLRPVKYPRPN